MSIFDKDFWESPSGQFIKGAGSNILDSFTGGLGSWFLNNIDYNRNNEYNSPVNQKQRLLAAGLSAPAADAAIAGSSQMATASTAATSNGSSSLGQYIALQELGLRKKEVAANVENIESQTRKNEAETARFNALTPVEIKKMSQDIEESKTRLHLNGANARLAEVTANRVEQMTSVEVQKLQEEVKEIWSRILLNDQLRKNEKAKHWQIVAQTESLNLDNWLKEHTNRLAVALNVDPRSTWYLQLVQNLKGGDVSALDAIMDGIANTVGHVYDRTVGKAFDYVFGD